MISLYHYIQDCLAMGHYGAYVWSAYGLVTMVLVLNVWAIKSQRQQIRRRLQRWFKDQVK